MKKLEDFKIDKKLSKSQVITSIGFFLLSLYGGYRLVIDLINLF